MNIADLQKSIRDLLAKGQVKEAFAMLGDLLPRSSPARSLLLNLQNQLTLRNEGDSIEFSDREKNAAASAIMDLLRRWQTDPLVLIDIARQTNATFLDLGKCSLSAIPEEIVSLQPLEELNLGSVYWNDQLGKFSGTRNDGSPNDFSGEDFSILQKLPNLRKLSARGCKLKTLEYLARLPQLEVLSVAQNDISDLEPLRRMPKLRVLTLFGNRIEHIQPLAELSDLRMLSINHNKVSDISPLAGLKHLEELYLADNKVQSIEPLQELTSLEVLNIDANYVEKIAPISRLDALKTLNLNANPVRDCPPEIAFSGDIALIRAFFRASQLVEKVGIALSPLAFSSTEISSGQKRGRNNSIPTPENPIPVLEVKVILVGNSSAGKTSISKLLRGLSHDTKENTTHGIQVSEWMVNPKDISNLRSKDMAPYRMKVNIWDFGGQEYYHGTHRIFLDSNAVYLLVWDAATNKNEEHLTTLFSEGEALKVPIEHFHFQYWLDNIRFHTLSGTPPIILLENKADLRDGQPHWHDLKMLQDKKVRHTASISARYADARDFRHKRYRFGFEIFKEDLLRVLVKEAEAKAQIAHLPPDWVIIKDEIRKFQQSEESDNAFKQSAGAANWISRDRFDHICQSLSKNVQGEVALQLKNYLHQTGVIVWLPEIDETRIYLNPSRLTEKMYQVLNNKVRQQNGLFQRSDIMPFLESEEESERMLQLMKTWELIIPHSNALDTWLAPQYLPQVHPMENLFTIALAGLQDNFLLFRAPLFHIRRMMRHLILKIGKHPQVQASEFWKYGMLFVVATEQEKIRIFIKTLPLESPPAQGQIMVCVEPGKTQTEPWKELLVREILNAFAPTRGQGAGSTGSSGIAMREIAQSQKNLAVSLDGRQFVQMDELIRDADAGFSAVITDKGSRVAMKHFGALLRATEIEPPTPSIFISYAHEDSELRNALGVHLEPMQRLGLAMTWSDVKINPGQEWNEAILGQLRSADIILMLVSPDSLASDYIWKTELAEALKRQEKGRCRIIPVLLRPCDWVDMPFAHLEMTPKHPETNRLLAVSTWKDIDEALDNVVQSIKKVLQEMAVYA